MFFHVEKSIFIDKAITDISQILTDFNTWRAWSPWLCQEKSALVSIENQPHTLGHSQFWQGTQIGIGKMNLVGIEPQKLSFTIDFIKPWKSHSQTTFKLEPQDEGTKVTWTMLGTIPFYLFFMKKMMIAWIGSDYQRGLLMLKAYLETGEVQSNSEIKGMVEKKGFSYLGIKQKSSLAAMPSLMQQDFEKLTELVSTGKIPSPDQYLAFYHKFDLVKKECEFTSALAYFDKTVSNKDFVQGVLPAHNVAQVIHTGSYSYLGNAWSTIMGYQRYHKLKVNKKIPWYELYLNSSAEVANSELKTEINIPIK